MRLHKSKSGIKSGSEVALNLVSDVICESNDRTNFPYKLLLTDRQVSRLFKAFTNNSSGNKVIENSTI